MDVYIIHDSSLEVRKENVQNIKDTLINILHIENIITIDTFDHKTINQEEVKKILRTNKPVNPTETDKLFEKFIHPMNINNISNYLKHIRAYESIIKAKRPSIILEDDVIISSEIEGLIKSLHETVHDIVFCGQPFTELPKEKFTPVKNLNDMTLLPSCESYFIRPNIASILIKEMLPMVYTTNIAISAALNNNELQAYKMYPNAFIDGSKLGKYTSHINNNNILLFNRKYTELYQMIREENDAIDLDKFEEIFKEAEFNTSPDMLYLKGIAYLKHNKLIEAKSIFDDVYEKFCEDGCSLNKTSSFMNNYLNFFRVLQQ